MALLIISIRMVKILETLSTVDGKGSSQNVDNRPAKVCDKHFPQAKGKVIICLCGSVCFMAMFMVST